MLSYDINLGTSVWPNVEVTGEFAREAGIIAAIGLARAGALMRRRVQQVATSRRESQDSAE